MSQSMYVILDSNTKPTSEQMTAAAEELGFAAVYEPGAVLTEADGFFPVAVDGVDVGFELFVYPVSKLEADVSPAAAEIPTDGTVYELCIGGNPFDLKAALISVSVLVSKFDGIALDIFSGTVIPADQFGQMMGMLDTLDL